MLITTLVFTLGVASDTLPIRHVADVDAARRGERLFTSGTIAPPTMPLLALRSLWMVWGEIPPLTTSAYWRAFSERYGMHAAPFDNGGLPLGIRARGDNAVIDCLACHAGKVAGQVVIGAVNTHFDMQGLMDDLAALARLGGIHEPLAEAQGTGAAGVNDAWGLGMRLAHAYQRPATKLATTFGYQRPGAWWTLKYKDTMYSDGAASAYGHRTMMAMLLAYGVSPSEIRQRDADFSDVLHFIWSLPAPRWPFGELDQHAVSRGRTVFSANCASCHGTYAENDGEYPDVVVPFEVVGTDAKRAQRFGPKEARYLNGFLDGVFRETTPLQSTGGYVAPPLVGIWARAPYFHNGAVPTLAAVLESDKRPAVWRRTGNESADYDRVDVGLHYIVPARPKSMRTLQERRVYDTARAGLSKAGHTYGDELSSEERADLLEYLKSL